MAISIAATTRSVDALVPLDHRIRAVVVDRLEVLRLEHIGHDAVVRIQPHGDVAHQVLDELGILVGTLGDELLVGPLEQPPQLARRLFLGHAHQRLHRQLAGQLHVHGDMRALVVRAILRDLLRARAQAGHRHQRLQEHPRGAVAHFTGQRDLVVQQRLHAGHRRDLADEVRERDLDAAGLGFELLQHLVQHQPEAGQLQRRPLFFQQRHEARHMRALLVGGQVHVEVEGADGRHDAGRGLQGHGIAHALHADSLDRDLAGVGARLDVGHDEGGVDVIHLRFPPGLRSLAQALTVAAFSQSLMPRNECETTGPGTGVPTRSCEHKNRSVREFGRTRGTAARIPSGWQVIRPRARRP
ncbi:protein of unknown function [Cupriavidus taiwanensis]|uniref:Uncharacterized protein n=1 Tax=Cupriavidus taiwanensis TaxID=164546 RepID=A0A9Q7UVB2_9BURK|nr:protein of unknown function [Cupriavidus taiwanensis]